MSLTGLVRARRALSQAGLDEGMPLERVPHTLNEVWYAGHYVLRVTPSPMSRRLEHEAAVARVLPPEVLYPTVVSHGRGPLGEWLLLRRVPGQPLSRTWPEMSDAERRRAVSQVADALRALHSVVLPQDGPAAIAPPFLDHGTLECPHQLPPARTLELVDQAMALRYVDSAMLANAAEIVRIGEAALNGDHEARTLVHGDLHFENILWDGGEVSALIDFEWARPGPPDLDLDVLLRFCAEPGVNVAKDYEQQLRRRDYREVPVWLRESYPGLFAHPRLSDRLALYSLAYDLRELLLRPPRCAVEQLPMHHPYNRIRRLVEMRRAAHSNLW
jgi:aminoglycoside phosphotransferase (APT) family kinase protein